MMRLGWFIAALLKKMMMNWDFAIMFGLYEQKHPMMCYLIPSPASCTTFKYDENSENHHNDIYRSCISEDTNWPCIASLSFPRQLSKHSADGEITMSASLNHATWFVRKNQWNILVGFIVNHFGRLRIRFLYKFICSESVWSNFIRALKHSTKTHATPGRCQTKPTSCQKSVNLLFL